MNEARDRAIHYAVKYGPGFVVWESPDKIMKQYQVQRDDKAFPGPGWVKVWPVEESSKGENDDKG